MAFDQLTERKYSLDQWIDAIKPLQTGEPIPEPEDMPAEAEALQARFTAWLDDPDYWNGNPMPAIGTPEYATVRASLEYASNIASTMASPYYRTAFVDWAMHEPECADLILKSCEPGGTLHYDLLRADLFKGIGERMRAPSGTGQPRTSSLSAELFGAPLNKTFVTKNADGKWVEISEARLANLAAQPDGPHILVTGNHAFFDIKMHFNSIINLYDRLFSRCAETSLVTVDKPDLGKDDTIMVCALEWRENNFLNLEDLFRTQYDIERDHDAPQDHHFEHCSPMTVSIASLMLRSILDNPAATKKLESVDGKLQLAADEAPRLFHGKITLRPDAQDVLRKYIFNGFSKAGNAQLMAMRLLVNQLDARDENGQPLVEIPGGSVRDIIESVSMTIGALNEKPLADYYREFGVNVPLISNLHDGIAPAGYEHRHDNPSLCYKGKPEYFGHAPGYKRDGSLDTPTIRDHYRNVYAAARGEVALTNIDLGDKAVRLEFAPNTTDAMVKEHTPLLKAALAEQGLADLELAHTGSKGRCRYELRSSTGTTDLHDKKVIASVTAAFETLAEVKKGWRISEGLCNYALPALAKEAGLARHRGAHVPTPSNQLGLGARQCETIQRMENTLPLHPRINSAPAEKAAQL